AAFKPRRQTARFDAYPYFGPAQAAEEVRKTGDHRLRDPRPDRSDDHGRPHLRDEARPYHAGGYAGQPLPQAEEHVRGGLYRRAGDEYTQKRAGRKSGSAAHRHWR